MAGCNGIFSALLFYGFLCYFCVKHDTFNDHSGRSMLDDPFDVFLTRISYTETWKFHTEILSKLTQRTTDKWRPKQSRSISVPRNKQYIVLILLLSGDVSLNPGPVRHPCRTCEKPVKRNQMAFLCDFCERWIHRKCTSPIVTESEFRRLEETDDNFFCQHCVNRLPELSDSYFANSSLGNETFASLSEFDSLSTNQSYFPSTANISIINDSLPSNSRDADSSPLQTRDQNNRDGSQREDPYQEMRQVRSKCRNNVLISYLNINSFRYKFMEIGEILYDQLSDICFFAETKLDATFNQNCFSVPDYKSFRQDRNSSGGGLMVYVRSNLPVRHRPDLELESPAETIVLDVCINNRKWAVVGAYRPPWVDNKRFSDIVTKGTDKIATQFDNILILGDLNYDCMDKSKGSTLFDLCDIFDFRNLIKSPTCFTKNFTPSLPR